MEINFNEYCLANVVIIRDSTIKAYKATILVSVRALQGKAARIPERRK